MRGSGRGASGSGNRARLGLASALIAVVVGPGLGLSACGTGSEAGAAVASGARAAPRRAAVALAYSRAGNQVIQPQPPAGSCHAIGRGLYERPDPGCTPGALNPAVSQDDIDQTICVTGWTATVRPPEAVSEAEKRASLAAYGDSGPLRSYEYDHLIPLALGGATNDARNLWPEPGASPNPKDAVELSLRGQVCSGRISLAAAQREIASDWVSLSRRLVRSPRRGS